MKIENNKVIEVTESELFTIYLEKGYDDLFSFDDYKQHCKELGTKITDELLPQLRTAIESGGGNRMKTIAERKHKTDILRITGTRCRRLRVLLGLSVSDMAKVTGYSRGTIYSFEHGKVDSGYLIIAYLLLCRYGEGSRWENEVREMLCEWAKSGILSNFGIT